MTKRFLITVGLMGALSVILGSFGAHILSGNIPEKDLHLFNVANDYLMFHTLALLGLAFMNRYVSRSYLNIIYYLFVIGVILFSGTIFISSLKELTGFSPGGLSKLTPIGGLLMVAGWITVLLSGVNYQHKKRHH
jgi:uncharacterized membrane protein YgdD (TMEM256/DUF423 family)